MNGLPLGEEGKQFPDRRVPDKRADAPAGSDDEPKEYDSPADGGGLRPEKPKPKER